MADAKKCDRCGSFYDKYSRTLFNKYVVSKYVSDMYKSDLVKVVDLCPKCSELLDNWMGGTVDFVPVGDYKDWGPLKEDEE